MGNTNSSTNPSIDLINTSVIINDDIFKVDNINSYGRKHASAKLQVSNDHLCIKQKHRQSLQIPLETIKRYGLDGSIFILECGRHAPLGQARYAFRCKQACRLVNCLDQRITIRSKQLLEQQQPQQQQQQPHQDTSISSSSTFTNITSITQRHHRRRRTHSEQDVSHRQVSSMIFSSASSSSLSLNSQATFFYPNSQPNLSENYFDFDTLPHSRQSHTLDENRFLAKLKHPVERDTSPELNYIEFKTESMPISSSTYEQDIEIPIATVDADLESAIEQSNKQCKSNKINGNTTMSKSSAPYVYIDHEKTVTLKDVVNERLQQQKARRMEN